jgi:hypothetical protein
VNDRRDQVSALNARDDLLAIADAWPALRVRLGQAGQGDRSGVRTKPASRPPIDVHVSDVIGELTAWVMFLAHVLVDETDWTPRDVDTPLVLRQIARERVGHFTAHEDEMLAMTFVDDARENRRKAETTAYPSGRRRIKLGIPCADAGTGEDGSRIPCGGEYAVTLVEDNPLFPDMVCTSDATHRITPAEWQQASRKTGTMDPEAMAALAARIKGDAA